MNLALTDYQLQAAAMIERRRALHGDLVMTAGTGEGQQQQQQQQDPPQTQQQQTQQEPQSGAEAVDENGKGLGFPAKTPTEQMNADQRAAYWRNQSKVQQRINESRGDYDQLKADAEAYRAQQAAQQTPSEQAIAAAKLEAKKEVAGDAALESLRAILSSRGKDETTCNALLGVVSPDRFVTTEGKVDHQKVTAYADSVASAGSQQGGGGFGQGRYEQPNQSRSAAGKAEAERRYGKKS